jgi:hypothetical protein
MSPETLDVLALALDGGPPDTVLTLPNGSSGTFVVDGFIFGATGPRWDAKADLTAAGGKMYVAVGDRPEVRVYDDTGVLQRLIRWPGPTQAVTTAMADSDLSQAIRNNPAGEEVLKKMYEVLPVADSVPYMGEIVASSFGLLWVGDYRPHRGSAQSRYTVFDATGAAVQRMIVEPGMTILDMRDKELLVLVRDSLDVERIAIVPVSIPQLSAGSLPTEAR